MKFLVFAIVLIVSISIVNSFLCQSFNKKTKLFDQVCESIGGVVPGNCPKLATPIEPCRVLHLKISGCDGNVVWNAIGRYYLIQTLDISNSGYKSLNWLGGSNFKMKHLRKFNASHNEISYVWKLLRDTSEVIEIDISYNKLKSIDSDSFSGLKKLRRIYLSFNELKYISKDALKHLSHLEYIDLSNNFFRDVPAFPNNNRLKAVHLERNPIVYFNCPSMGLVNRALIHLPWQTMLSFYGRGSCENQRIRVIPDSIREMLSISYIGKNEMHINEQSLRKMYSFIGGRDSFASISDLIPYFNDLMGNLDLSGNFIGSINQSTFERFDQLITLSLSDTQLRDFDLNMIKNQNYRLKTLDISFNDLNCLTNVPYLARFFSLSHFNVAGNRLSNIPDVIHYLRPTIKELDLTGNFVGVLNATTFERFTLLETLKLRNTNITISRVNPFKKLKSLSHLDISHNNLRAMNFSILSNFSQLIQLNMAHCQVTNISRIILRLKSTIKHLDLAGNSGGIFNNRTFKLLPNLEFVNLSNTNIAKFDFGILANLTGVRYFA